MDREVNQEINMGHYTHKSDGKVLLIDTTKEGTIGERIRGPRENSWGISRLGLQEKGEAYHRSQKWLKSHFSGRPGKFLVLRKPRKQRLSRRE